MKLKVTKKGRDVLCWEYSLEKEMETHSSILAWKMDRGAWWATVHGSKKIRHD